MPTFVPRAENHKIMNATNEAAYKVKLPAMRDWLIEVARSGKPVTYGDVSEVFGIDRFSRRYALDYLSKQAVRMGEPCISALVVEKETQRCSQGFMDAFGVDDREERKKLYSYWKSHSKLEGQAKELAAIEREPTLEAKAARFVSVEARPDQAAFRRRVFLQCAGRCVVSGCEIVQALDAAHKHGCDWRKGQNSGKDGYVMRKDLHALYDAKLLHISEDCIVSVDSIIVAHYGQFVGVDVSNASATL